MIPVIMLPLLLVLAFVIYVAVWIWRKIHRLKQAGKDPTTFVIAVVVVTAFLLCFIPIPLPCKGDGERYHSRYVQHNDNCLACEGTGIAFRTVWNYLNR